MEPTIPAGYREVQPDKRKREFITGLTIPYGHDPKDVELLLISSILEKQFGHPPTAGDIATIEKLQVPWLPDNAYLLAYMNVVFGTMWQLFPDVAGQTAKGQLHHVWYFYWYQLRDKP